MRARVPSLDKALEATRGKCGVYLDAKEIPAPAIVAALRRHSLEDRCVGYGSFPLLRALAAMGHRRRCPPWGPRAFRPTGRPNWFRFWPGENNVDGSRRYAAGASPGFPGAP